MNFKLPGDKSDVESLKKLEYLKLESLSNKEIDELLSWLQDMHWEVSHIISKYFSQYVNQVKPNLIRILNSNDDEWKFNVLKFLVFPFQGKIDVELLAILNRINLFPTEGEREEGVDEVSREILGSDSGKVMQPISW